MSTVTNGPCHICGKVEGHTFTFAQVHFSNGDVEKFVNTRCSDGTQHTYRSIEVNTS